MSTLATQPNESLSWKQEVNRRLAEHKSRRTSGAAESAPADTYHAANPRAAQAAARVAARYAKAPSYNQMLAEEARAALRAAEAAGEAARQAQAAAESVLAEIETASARPAFEQAPAQRRDGSAGQASFFDPFLEVERPVAPAERPSPQQSTQPLTGQSISPALEIRWEPDMPIRLAEPDQTMVRRQPEMSAAGNRDDWRAAYGEPETVEPAQTIAANLIEFPRELIAARRARPRIAEGPLAPGEAQPGQLSIFEVDASTISVQPEPVTVAAEPTASGWSRIRLDAEAAHEPAASHAAEPRTHAIELAPFGLRLMSAVIDGSLVLSVVVAVGLAIASNVDSPLPMKTAEMTSGIALLAIGVLYQAFFFTLARATPGMRYAGLSLCNFDREEPTRAQMRRRVGALMLSVLPVGLGLLWAIFDEDHLSWHDRISKTYQRWG